MSGPEPVELASHIDRVRRRTMPFRGGVVVREFRGGWLSFVPGAPRAEFPSASADRIYWLAGTARVGEHEIETALGAAREIGQREGFIWLAPWRWNERTEA